MNKNIFRAIRRQCKEIFEEFLSKRSRLNSKIKRIFRENLALFSRCLLRETQIDVSSIDGFSEQDFVKYLGLFINYWIMKRELMPTAHFEKAVETNDLLYAYSHKKFRDYLSIPEVNVIIRILFERIGESEFIANHEALNSNPRAYMNQIQKIKMNILDN